MKIASLFIGNELLNGQTTNINILSLGQQLADAGFSLSYSDTVPDDLELIKSCIIQKSIDFDVLVICGGLGPTVDDITRKATALAIDAELGFSEEVCQKLKDIMAKKGRQPTTGYYERQSEVIVGAKILNNSIGLAPGLLCEFNSTKIFLLPGPPREFTPMLEESVIPCLKSISPPQVISDLFHIYGISESRVEKSFQPFLEKYPFVSPAYCANLGRVKLTISYGLEHKEMSAELKNEVNAIFGDDITQSVELIDDIAQSLEQKQWSLGTAESCTGGWIGQAITAYAGASNFFQGSVNTYANEWKMNLLGVAEQTLIDHGAVSEECATEMISGLCSRYELDCGIICTGIAGPGGGSDEKPVGTVYIGSKTPISTLVTRFLFSGSRKEVREQTVRYGLNQLRKQLITDK
jgi:nicotinamide-nucleotide amidase